MRRNDCSVEGFSHITVTDSDKGHSVNSYHTDETFLAEPPLVSLLHAKQLPEYGGDTAFLSTVHHYAARDFTRRRVIHRISVLPDNSHSILPGGAHGN